MDISEHAAFLWLTWSCQCMCSIHLLLLFNISNCSMSNIWSMKVTHFAKFLYSIIMN